MRHGSAEAIVKEIQRRFLPCYLEIARKAEEIQLRHDESARALEACMGALKGEPLEDTEKQNGKVHFHLEEIWGSVQYGSDDQLDRLPQCPGGQSQEHWRFFVRATPIRQCSYNSSYRVQRGKQP